jgi:hypothetical protein
MTVSRIPMRVVTAAEEAAASRVDPSVAADRLRWRLAAYRRSAILRVEQAVAGMVALREKTDDPTIGPMLDRLRAVQHDLRTLDVAGRIKAEDVQGVLERLASLQVDLARLTGGR